MFEHYGPLPLHSNWRAHQASDCGGEPSEQSGLSEVKRDVFDIVLHAGEDFMTMAQ